MCANVSVQSRHDMEAAGAPFSPPASFSESHFYTSRMRMAICIPAATGYAKKERPLGTPSSKEFA